MEKVKLKFRVDPDYLKNNTIVEDAVRIKFIDPEKVYVLGMLGESGRTMMLDGAIFEFERKQAEWMIEQKIAVIAENVSKVTVITDGIVQPERIRPDLDSPEAVEFYGLDQMRENGKKISIEEARIIMKKRFEHSSKTLNKFMDAIK